MGTITIRRLDDVAHQNLREHAAREGKSVEAVLRDLVQERWGKPPPDFTLLDELGRRFREATKDDPRTAAEMIADARIEDVRRDEEKWRRIEADWARARAADIE